MYDASYVHDETEKTEYNQLGQKIYKLLEDGKNGEAMSSFLKGIGIPKVFVFFMRLFPGWQTMVALAPTLAYDIALTSDVPPVERASRIYHTNANYRWRKKPCPHTRCRQTN